MKIMLFAAIAAAFALACPARAQQAGTADPAAALNEEVGDKTACMSALFYYFDGGQVRDLGDAAVKKVLVLAIMTPRGVAMIEKPVSYYVLEKKAGADL